VFARFVVKTIRHNYPGFREAAVGFVDEGFLFDVYVFAE
jgi:hypothetical protein